MARCPICSFENPVGHVFCENCGTALPLTATFQAEDSPASSIEKSCSHCGAPMAANTRFCERCGAPAGTSPAPEAKAAPSLAALPPRPPPVESGNGLLIAGVIIAGLIGLGAGGYLIYRMQHAKPTQAVVQSTPPAIQKSLPAAAVTPPENPPVVDAAPPPAPIEAQPEVRPPTHSSKPSAATTPPSLITTDSSAAEASPTPVEPVPAEPPPTPAVEHPRPAVQEPDSSPAPAQTATAEAALPAIPSSAPAPTIQPAYNGPTSGTAVWSGKLEKDGTLTITGGTPSSGILTGAPLPGVPVKLSIVESNLGFAEMPNASNGYRRLVLKSHSKHDKITIRWTVR